MRNGPSRKGAAQKDLPEIFVNGSMLASYQHKRPRARLPMINALRGLQFSPSAHGPCQHQRSGLGRPCGAAYSGREIPSSIVAGVHFEPRSVFLTRHCDRLPVVRFDFYPKTCFGQIIRRIFRLSSSDPNGQGWGFKRINDQRAELIPVDDNNDG